MALSPYTKNTLSASYGFREDQTHVQARAKAAAADADFITAGSVVRMTNAYEFGAGVGTDKVMPMFVFSRADEADTSGLVGPSPHDELDVWSGFDIPGDLLALVGNSGYELVSTQYVDAAYPPNTPLTSAKTTDDRGKLVAGIIGTNMIVGLVSGGITDNGHGFSALAFYTQPIFP